MKVLYLFGNAKTREKAWTLDGVEDGKSFLFHGMDVIARQEGYGVLDSLSLEARLETSVAGRLVNKTINQIVRFLGGYGGSWYKVFRMRQHVAQADVVVSTVDRVGIPLVMLSYLRILPRRNIVYISIGLPERLAKMKLWFLGVFCRAFTENVNQVICYGYEESVLLKKHFSSVEFVPFGVDETYFHLNNESQGDGRVVCVGVDAHRDFTAFLGLAENYPEYHFLLITSHGRAQELKRRKVFIPENVELKCDIPLHDVKSAMAKSLCVVLPVKENSYSGATTTLLQAMALAKPVIVSKTGAIAEGYYLKNLHNVILIPPSSKSELHKAFSCIAKDSQVRDTLSKNARETIEHHLTQKHYTDKIRSVIQKASNM